MKAASEFKKVEEATCVHGDNDVGVCGVWENVSCIFCRYIHFKEFVVLFPDKMHGFFIGFFHRGFFLDFWWCDKLWCCEVDISLALLCVACNPMTDKLMGKGSADLAYCKGKGGVFDDAGMS